MLLVLVIVEKHAEELDLVVRPVDAFDDVSHTAVPIHRKYNEERVDREDHHDLGTVRQWRGTVRRVG